MSKSPHPANGAPKKSRVSLKDVAVAAGVSIATASYALNQTGAVSTEVRRKVQRVAERLGYIPNTAAQSMRTGKTNSIGLVLPDLKNPFFPELAQAVETQARASGYSVFLIDCQGAPEVEREGVGRLVSQGVEGIVWCPCSATDTLAEFRESTPVVVVDRPMENYDVVMSDYDSGGRTLAKLLVDRKAERIGLISGPQNLLVAKLRRDAFLDHKPDHFEIVWETETEFSLNLSPQAKKRCRSIEGVDVIVCANDMIAIAVIAELKAAGTAVPDDVGVVGFDDVPWATIVSPALTTVRQSLAELGSQATALLLSRIIGDPGSLRRINIGVELVERESL